MNQTASTDVPPDKSGSFEEKKQTDEQDSSSSEAEKTDKAKAEQAPEGEKTEKTKAELMKEELDEIKVATMRNMVDKISLDVQESKVDINALYLTNSQANKVKIDRMPEVRAQLGIEDPKMVIRLMPCHFGKTYWKTFPLYTSDSKSGGRFPTKRIPELSPEDQEDTEHQLILLAKDVLLPLASQTRSLVIGSESCALTAAFVQVSAPSQRQLGEACPFRLLIFAHAYYFDTMADKETSSVAHEVRKKCKAWSKSSFKESLAYQYGEDEAFWPLEDLPTGKYSLILFECKTANTDKPAHEISNTFSNDFMSSLSEELPVIALQTYGNNKMNMVPALAEHVTRGLPLMLLDSRRREPKGNIEEARQALEKFSQDLHSDDAHGARLDQYFTSTLAYVKACLDKKRHGKSGSAGSGKGKNEKIWQAIEKRLQDANDPVAGPLEPCRIPSDEAKKVNDADEVMEATNLVMSYVGKELEWESKWLQAHCRGAIDEVMKAKSWKEFQESLEENWVGIRSCCFHKFKEAKEFADENSSWIRLDEKAPSSHMGTKVLRIQDVAESDASVPKLDEAKARLEALLEKARKVSEEYDRKAKTTKAFVANQDMWLAVYDILKEAPNVNTGNVHSLEDVEGTLFSLAQIDRLPPGNTLEGLVLLRAAWTVVDIFNESARAYKLYAKVTYLLLLLLAVGTVTFTVLSGVYGSISAEEKKAALLLLALSASCLTAYTALVDPSRKWMQLRNGAYILEAEIWKFRARVGDYAPLSNSTTKHGRLLDERRAEALLQQSVLQVQGRVRLGAGLKETSFYAMPMTSDDLATPQPNQSLDETARTTSSPWIGRGGGESPSQPREQRSTHVAATPAHCQHGQYKRADKESEIGKDDDNFHSPTRPEDYIRWRLVPKLKFYQGRIPRYAYKRRAFQAAILLSSIATSLLAALGETTWTAIIAALTSAVAGWQEFVDVARKLQRYSTVAAALGDLVIWWQALTEVDKASLKNVTFLVEQTESLLAEERNAWVTEAQLHLRLEGLQNGTKGPESAQGGKA